ncbi:guanine-1-methyltransferase-domain-containing protein [Leucosporidium creatinivorum]|uniref:tRNA (guanine(9)-N1)-methyltransferase n=1 Tax=Leucosporidium creatinivorum TaxID=106004 RepID=A0A1Y2G129_9BASI|nr:guanine-1-methyltransferase-domain-containing protein [Leucosporidium creatinivorum]
MSAHPSLPPAAPAPAEAAAPASIPSAETEAAPIASTSSAPSHNTAPNPFLADMPAGLSKNAQKRWLKQAAFDAAKPARRAKERAMKKEKAAEKRKLIELGVLEKPTNKKAKGRKEPFKARVVVDCAFDDKMTEKEVKSMAAQLAFCYSSNRASSRPLDLLISGLSGRMKEKFESTPNKPHEAWKGVEWWEEGYEELWAEPTPSSSAETIPPPPADASTTTDAPSTTEAPPTTTAATPSSTVPPVSLGFFAGQPRSRVPKSSIIYLTGDSPNVLTTIEEDKTYILGGIVDRNRYKKLCFDKAEAQGITHAQLPIGQFMPDMPTRKVLTVNQVYDILLQYVETKDWTSALQAVMPTRKMEHGGPGGRKGRRGKDGEVVEGAEGEGEGESGEDGEEVEGKAVYEVKSGDEMEVEAEKGEMGVEAEVASKSEA